MASLRPTALILLLASAGALWLTQAGGGPAWAQPVSNARVVQAQQAASTPPGSPATPAVAAAPGVPALPPAMPLAAAGGSTSPAASASTSTPASSTAPAAHAAAAGATGVAGRVTGNSSPLAAAGVYAYQLATLTLHKVETDPQGNFLFRNLPAGLYKIIAHKAGFEPVVILLTHTTAQAYQFLELQ